MPTAAASLTLGVLRAEDLLALAFDCVNLRLELDPGSVPRLVRIDPYDPAFLVVRFPPQHIGEEIGRDPAASIIAGESRLVFAIPDELLPLPMTLDALLDWDRLTPALSPLAVPRDQQGTGPLQAPAALESAIELPYRLLLSPDETARWEHRPPPARAGWSELWHTRLVPRPPDASGESNEAGDEDEAGPSPLSLRVIWTPDYPTPVPPPPPDPPPDLLPLPSHRPKILRLSSDVTLDPNPDPGPDGRVTAPVDVEHLMLSSLGAWSRLNAVWPNAPIDQISVEGWRQITTMGRDQYVKVVRAGHLFPFGHRAAHIEITEREIPNGDDPVAGLIRREFIEVREPDKTFQLGVDADVPNLGRDMPFSLVRMTTLATPEIKPDAGEITIPNLPPKSAFWVMLDQVTPLQFGVNATDREGTTVSFTLPMIFVNAETPEAALGPVHEQYEARAERRSAALQGQKLAYAPDLASSASEPGETSLATRTLIFTSHNHGRGLPAISQAAVSVPAVEQMLGPAGASSAGTMLQFADAYLKDGYAEAANKAQLFMQVAQGAQVPSLSFPPDKTGGMVAAGMNIVGVSKMLGPVGGPEGEVADALQQAAGGKFDPKKYFGEAKILGGIALSDLVDDVNQNFDPRDFAESKVIGALPLEDLLNDTNRLIKVPMLTSRTIKENGLPVAVEAQYLWKPVVREFKIPDASSPVFKGTAAQLIVRTTVRTPLQLTNAGEPPVPLVAIEGWLTQLRLSFVKMLTVEIERLTFSSHQGRKTEIDVRGLKLAFDGPLEFVNTLQAALSKILGGGVEISVTDQGVAAGYRMALPSLGIGIFTLQNLSFAASLSIPFIDRPTGIRFAVCERQRPFTLTVSGLGGGGFFALAMDAGGGRTIEAAIEFGGSVSLNLGVASGGVSIMAGVYFAMINNDVKLTGYLRANGSLEVLGLITITAEFYLGLTYQSKGNKVWGQASLSVCVEILFFSKCVSISVERKFAGPGGDPTFDDLIKPDHWEAYCLAFAPAPPEFTGV